LIISLQLEKIKIIPNKKINKYVPQPTSNFIGRPHWGHVFALLLISLLHSLQIVNAISLFFVSTATIHSKLVKFNCLLK